MNIKNKRLLSQVIFLAIFATLMIKDKAQIWMLLIFSSIFLAAFKGRFYCGWICPINTFMRVGNVIGKALGTQKSDIPKFATTKKFRRLLTFIFMIALGYTMYTIKMGDKFPLPVIIITLGVLATIFINERTWHRYLCPWGILFSFTAKFTKTGLNVDGTGCKSCKKCNSVCPAEAIETSGEEVNVNKQYCIMCYNCVDTCSYTAIEYGKAI